MSAAPAAAPAQGDAPKKGGKKLIIIGAVVALLVLVLGGGAFFMMKKKHNAEGADEGDGAGAVEAKAGKKGDASKKAEGPPTFVPLDPFIVNLTDRDTERYAQIGINLQVDDAKVAEEMKVYMPAIRNAVLLILSHKSSEDLLSAEGKQKLASEIRRDAARAMGYEIYDPEEDEAADAASDTQDESAAPRRKKKKRRPVESYNPIVQVHYSNFIIQ